MPYFLLSNIGECLGWWSLFWFERWKFSSSLGAIKYFYKVQVMWCHVKLWYHVRVLCGAKETWWNRFSFELIYQCKWLCNALGFHGSWKDRCLCIGFLCKPMVPGVETSWAHSDVLHSTGKCDTPVQWWRVKHKGFDRRMNRQTSEGLVGYKEWSKSKLL